MSTLLSKLPRQSRLVRKFKFSRSYSGEERIIRGFYKNIEIPRITIPELVADKCSKYAKYTAIECAITGRKYTYDEILLKSRNLNKSLRKKLKLQQGDVVSVFLPNGPEFPIITVGVLQAGLTLTTLNPLYTAEEVARQLVDSGTKVILTIPELYDTTKAAIAQIKREIPVIVVKNKEGISLPQGAINFDEFASQLVDIEDVAPIDPETTAFLPYSSGTTGLPKGVELSHRNIVANVLQSTVNELSVFKETQGDVQDVVPAILPMFHIYGFTVNILCAMKNGAKLVALPKFTPESYISVLKNNKVNVIFAAPPLVLFLTTHPDVKKEYLSDCRLMMSGAAPLGALDEERILKKVGNHLSVCQGYGLTETAPVVLNYTERTRGDLKIYGSVGQPLPNTEVKVVSIEDKSFPSLGPNQTGELWVRGPQVMKGYYNKPEQTAEAFHEDWFRTGDLVHYNEHNFFFITDRLKELIKVKGFQVAPAELEEIIRAFPNVTDAAVIGVPHEISGEVPRAYVVPKQGTDLKVDKLQEFVAEKVAAYKQLKGGVEVVASIPKNASGKILRRQIKLEYQNKHGSS